MKEYILIQNDGIIEQNAFELIGASPKRGDTTKIGHFGSGLKYSIAYMMRHDIGFRIFAGEEEVIFTTEKANLKDKTFDRICINGRPTSYTTTMGPSWDKDWFVIREIYCNALDEGGCHIVKNTTHVTGVADRTRIYIEATANLQIVLNNWDKYFSDERETLFKTETIHCSYLGLNDGCTSPYRQPVTVYNKTEGILFRRGIKIDGDDKYLYDYEVMYADINEDRTARNSSYLQAAFVDMLSRFVDDVWVKTVLRNSDKCIERQSMLYYDAEQSASEAWVSFSQKYLLVVHEVSGKYEKEMAECKSEVFFIPRRFAIFLKKHHDAVEILGMNKILNGDSIDTVVPTPRMEFLLKETLTSLKEMDYHVHFDIEIADFDSKNVLGQADLKNKKIYLSKKVFDLGRKEIALTLMEENEHILTGFHDETRALQTHLFTKWLTAMEEKAALFF